MRGGGFAILHAEIVQRDLGFAQLRESTYDVGTRTHIARDPKACTGVRKLLKLGSYTLDPMPIAGSDIVIG